MRPGRSRRLVLVPFTPKRAGSLAYSLVMFVVVSVLAGVLVAGLFIPFAGMAGVTSNAAAAELESLPAELATPAPATRSKVLMGGKTLAFFYDENRIPVKPTKIAPIMRQAQIAIEDHRYYEHGALDFKAPCVRWYATPPPAAPPKVAPPSPSNTSKWCRSRRARPRATANV